MSPEKHTYATDAPAVLDAYRQARADRHEFSQKLLAAAAQIGHNVGPLSRPKTDGGEEIVGLKPDASGVAPIGWKFAERGNRLAPNTGHLGDKARAWLATHQPPPGTDPLEVLLGHGLVELSRVGDIHNYADYRPVVFEWDATLWACYKGSPLGEVTWPAVPIEDCLTAMARAEGARHAHAN